MKVLIVDDESLARKRINQLLSQLDKDFKIQQASNGKEAVDLISNFNPDIVFLDIQMTDMSGFEVLERITGSFPIVIFVTAFDDFAVKAFEVKALDFLLKPFKKERFYDSLNRAIHQLEIDKNHLFSNKLNNFLQFINNNENYNLKKEYLERLVLKLGKKYYFIDVNEIEYISSSSYYVEIYTKSKKKHLYRISVSELINKLNPDEFARINRSTIIHLNQVKEIISEGLGDFTILLDNGKNFQLTKKYKIDFLNKMNIKNKK